MKRITIIPGLLLMTTVCMAQTLAQSERNHHIAFAPVPKELTLDVKPYMAAVEYEFESDKSGIGIYSSFGPDGAVLKFDVPNAPSSETYYEKATGYSEKVVIKDKFYDRMDYSQTYKDSTLQVIEEGVKRAYGYKEGFHLTEFTDPDGETGYYGNDYSRYGGDSTRCFYEFGKYGKMYPMEFFVVDTAGILKHCHFFHYEMEYDFTGAVWVTDMDFTEKLYGDYNKYVCTVQGFRFQNLDESFYPNSIVAVSQNVFNKDSDWEYILTDVENYREYGEPCRYDDGAVRRSVYQMPVVKGYIIMNSKGVQLLYIPVPDEADEHTLGAEIRLLSVMDGVIYVNASEVVCHGSLDNMTDHFEECQSMYAVSPNTTGIQSVSRRTVGRLNIDATAVSKGNNLGIHVSEPVQGDNIVISSMSGSVLNQTPLGNTEHISIETSAYPKGVYNVTLQGSSDIENQRIIIK